MSDDGKEKEEKRGKERKQSTTKIKAKAMEYLKKRAFVVHVCQSLMNHMQQRTGACIKSRPHTSNAPLLRSLAPTEAECRSPARTRPALAATNCSVLRHDRTSHSAASASVTSAWSCMHGAVCFTASVGHRMH